MRKDLGICLQAADETGREPACDGTGRSVL